jgi:RsiW-degrading membrane proteinase PrsW (M82 family)
VILTVIIATNQTDVFSSMEKYIDLIYFLSCIILLSITKENIKHSITLAILFVEIMLGMLVLILLFILKDGQDDLTLFMFIVMYRLGLVVHFYAAATSCPRVLQVDQDVDVDVEFVNDV